MNVIEDLRQRGMIQDIMPGTEELLAKEKVAAYVGVDPTADSMHVGNLATIMLLVFLQKYGHTPVALVGGATGMIGDPSGKSAERNLLDEETLLHNQKGVRAQLEKLLDFDTEANPARLENNYSWFKDMGALDFLRNVGKHLTINYMMAKDSVKSRVETGLSFTEFSYQLIQGYDFYHLYKNGGVKIQMGGSDQWGNITAGTELIRRMDGGEAFAFTCPLITKADGSKFGKSEGGNIWLDPNQTSPYKFYQFWMNATDEDAAVFIKRFTLLPMDEIEALIAEHEKAPHLRALQQKLAEEITVMVHSRDAYDQAVRASQALFKGSKEDLMALSKSELLEVLEGVPTHTLKRDSHGDSLDMVSFLSTETGILPSKSEAMRSLKANSISINKEKVAEGSEITEKDLLNGEFILVQKGKKNKFLVILE
ncbi:tyrosine--tRNA ligase [Leucothrix pacifica]|uniref:Tyrosine--tRNA ligase n=1 Tax=Leucothrix pacifica TaxID=1247513 RepID=A0A317C7J7_9GAMM|nr:tyrosine--tRNA ligase [Leucothrix pacifica]PWQ92062.1 tyrosine--tRNA ligase [Leucothrix pacifica]